MMRKTDKYLSISTAKIEDVIRFVFDNHLYSGLLDKDKILAEFNTATKEKYPTIHEQIIILSNCIGHSVEYLYKKLNWPLPDKILPLVKGFKRWWGNVGIMHLGKTESIWYPLRTNKGLLDRFEEMESELVIKDHSNIISLVTANNKLLIINRNNIKKLKFLEEGADEPRDDWDNGFRLPSDIEGEVGISSLRMIYNYHHQNKHPLTKIQENFLGDIYDDFFDLDGSTRNFRYDYLSVSEIVERYFDNISIHYIDGSCEYKKMDDWASDLYEKLITKDSPPEFISIYDDDDQSYVTISMNSVSLIEIPLISLIDHLKGAKEE